MYRVNPQSEWRNFVSEKFESMKKVKNFLVLEIVSLFDYFQGYWGVSAEGFDGQFWAILHGIRKHKMDE